jgi:hypothetical protein
MRAVFSVLIAAMLAGPLSALAWIPASAQAKKTAPSTAPATRYFTYLNDLMDGDADVILRQARSGNEIKSASIDLCYPAPKGSERRDRVTVELKISGTSLTGTGTSLRDKTPVEIALTQVRSPGKTNAFDFGGSIRIGTDKMAVVSRETADISDREFNDNKNPEDDIVAAPGDFTEVSPESIAARVALDAVPDFIKNLRGRGILVSRNSLATGCDSLRAGHQTIQMTVNPLAAAEAIAQLRAQPGVAKVGWAYGVFDKTRTLRFPSGDWMTAGKIDNAKIATVITEALKSVLAATSATAAWDENSGKHTLRFKRPDAALGAFGLEEELEFTAMAAYDKPTETRTILLWLGMPWSKLVDGASAQKPLLIDSPGSECEDRAVNDNDAIAALARVFKAQKWDETTSQYK